MANLDELRALFESNMKGSGSVQGPNIFRDDIRYAPGFFLRRPTEEGGKLSFVETKPDELWTAAELNPTHLKKQGIESIIDGTPQNVIYSVSGGQIRVGFYDRKQLEGAKQPERSRDELKQSLRSMVQGADAEAPRISVMDIQPLIEAVLGQSFPNVFSYRSVVFGGDTTYGMFVDVDRAIVGEPLVAKNVPLTPEFVKEHPEDMNSLFPVLVRAARQQGLDFLDLDVSDSISTENRLGYLIHQLKGKYSATVSYRKTPQLAALARLNGVPLCLSLKNGQAQELAYGAIDMGDSYLAVISRGAFQNAEDPSNSLEGPIIYRMIPREESAAAKQANAAFGLLDIVVMKGCEIGDFEVQFKKIAEAPRLDASRDASLNPGEGALKMLSYGGATRGGYTAGQSTIGETKKARIETSPFGFERVLFRDVFCLVHREMAANPTPYTG